MWYFSKTGFHRQIARLRFWKNKDCALKFAAQARRNATPPRSRQDGAVHYLPIDKLAAARKRHRPAPDAAHRQRDVQQVFAVESAADRPLGAERRRGDGVGMVTPLADAVGAVDAILPSGETSTTA